MLWGAIWTICLTMGQVIPLGPGAEVGETEASAAWISSRVRGAGGWGVVPEGSGRSAPGALEGGSGKKVVANNSARCWGVLARPSGPLKGGTGVERVPEPHLASFQMLSGEADSQILV